MDELSKEVNDIQFFVKTLKEKRNNYKQFKRKELSKIKLA